jgi:hypothetical protein
MCLGAEHNGSSAPSILSLDLAKQRMAHLYRELEDIHEKL